MAGFLFMKICTKCGEEKEITEYYKSKNTKDGYAYWCKVCQGLKGVKPRIGPKYCVGCGKKIAGIKGATLCRDCFYKSMRSEYAICPICGIEKHRTEFKKNNRGRRRDTRKFSEGCNDCRRSRTTIKREVRLCVKCNTEKTLDNFTKSGNICIQCKQDTEIKRREEKENRNTRVQKTKQNTEKRIKEARELFDVGYKYCSNCEKLKELDKFNNNKNNRDGKQAWCQECITSRRQQWTEDNPDRNKQLRNKFKRTDTYKIGKKNIKYRRRQKLNQTPKELRLTAKQWKSVLIKYGNRCLCCGSTEDITIDHIKPLSKGGLNTIDNVQPLCHACNSNKRDTEIDYRPDFVKTAA